MYSMAFSVKPDGLGIFTKSTSFSTTYSLSKFMYSPLYKKLTTLFEVYQLFSSHIFGLFGYIFMISSKKLIK
ncbi:MAG: hypothetical protein DRP32_07195 [Thermotogae bacterium]|nr:MAG: hypothetical protein DRP32_07195 [Thermotogota bacterium]